MSWMRIVKGRDYYSPCSSCFCPCLLWDSQNHCAPCNTNVSLLFPNALMTKKSTVNPSRLVSAVSLPHAVPSPWRTLCSSLLTVGCSLNAGVFVWWLSFLPTRTIFLDVHCFPFKFFRCLVNSHCLKNSLDHQSWN